MYCKWTQQHVVPEESNDNGQCPCFVCAKPQCERECPTAKNKGFISGVTPDVMTICQACRVAQQRKR